MSRDSASALAVELGDARQFANARQFAASIGLVPRQYSTGGKPTLLGISKRGDRNLRRLLVQCARAVMQHTDSRTDALSLWVKTLSTRRVCGELRVTQPRVADTSRGSEAATDTC